MITCDQSSVSISNIFSILKNKFNKYFNINLNFRIIVIDYSWASIHAILETFNLENVIAYSKRVYRLAQMLNHELNECIKDYTWLISCCAHTMNRFVQALKPKISNSSIYSLCSYCFGLLVNCTDLNSMDDILKLILLIFISKKKSKEYLIAIEKVELLLSERPVIREEVNKIISLNEPKTFSIFRHVNNLEDETDQQELENSDEQRGPDLYDHELDGLNFTIKDCSPFTRHFNDICKETKLQESLNDSDNLEDNPCYWDVFINFLMERLMPYSFIWEIYMTTN